MKVSERFRKRAQYVIAKTRVEVFLLDEGVDERALVIRSVNAEGRMQIFVLEAPQGIMDQYQYAFVMATLSGEVISCVLHPGGVQTALF